MVKKIKLRFFALAMLVIFSSCEVPGKSPIRKLVIFHDNSSNWTLTDTTKVNPWPRSHDEILSIFIKSKDESGSRIKLFISDSMIFNSVGPFESMIAIKNEDRNDLLRLELIDQNIEFDVPSEINVIEIREDSLQVIIRYTP